MGCGVEPDLYGPVVVHRFDMGQITCRCGALTVAPREHKTSFTRQKKKTEDPKDDDE